MSFDRLSSVFLSNTNHEEDQPVHLKLKDPSVAIGTNWQLYASPEQRYCPAGVYEILDQETARPAADQRAELRSLQNLRHQGPDPEYRLDGALRAAADPIIPICEGKSGDDPLPQHGDEHAPRKHACLRSAYSVEQERRVVLSKCL